MCVELLWESDWSVMFFLLNKLLKCSVISQWCVWLRKWLHLYRISLILNVQINTQWLGEAGQIRSVLDFHSLDFMVGQKVLRGWAAQWWCFRAMEWGVQIPETPLWVAAYSHWMLGKCTYALSTKPKLLKRTFPLQRRPFERAWQ